MANQDQRPDTTAILRKLALVRRSMGWIPKSHKLDMGKRGYNYRGIDDLYEKLWAALDEHGVIVVPQVEQLQWEHTTVTKDGRESILTRAKGILRVAFVDVDTGQSVYGSGFAEGLDDSDKAAGKAMSYGMKNVMFHFFSIPTEDPDSERPSTTVDHGAETVSKFKRAQSLDSVREIWNSLDNKYRTIDVIKAKDEAKLRLAVKENSDVK